MRFIFFAPQVLVTHDYHTHQGNPVVHTWGRGLHNDHNENKEISNVNPGETIFEDNWKWMAEIDSKREEWHTIGSRRINMLLGIGSYFNSTEREATEVQMIRRSRYGLGNKRTLEQAREFTGINLVDEKMEVNRCGNLNWIPFQESPGYGVEETLTRAIGASETNPEVPLQEAKRAANMLRSLSSKNAGSIGDVGDNRSNTMFSEPVLDFGIGGGFVLLLIGVFTFL